MMYLPVLSNCTVERKSVRELTNCKISVVFGKFWHRVSWNPITFTCITLMKLNIFGIKNLFYGGVSGSRHKYILT